MQDNKDPNYRRIIESSKWKNIRRSYIGSHPLCEICLKCGRTERASEVHHIIPIESASTYEGMCVLAFDEQNLMSLCSRCHHEVHSASGSAVENRIRTATYKGAFISRWLDGKDEDNKTDR